jgi:hypothetical protein
MKTTTTDNDQWSANLRQVDRVCSGRFIVGYPFSIGWNFLDI